ncbi:MAG: DNA recombination protein RmuC [Fusobacteria bacterium]|nr:DNA recombination protein RmuC [Fusobacteriota bacterium]
MTNILFLIIGLFSGGVLIFLLALRREKRLKEENQVLKEEESKLRQMMEGQEKLFAEKEKYLNSKNMEVEKNFRAISNQVLKENNEIFLTLAKTTLDKQLNENINQLDKKEESIKFMVDPIKEVLGQVKGRMENIEKDYQKTFTEVKEQFKFLKEDQSKLQVETANLVKALRAPQTRGQWGEIHLKRVVEMAGMIKYVDFVEQHSTDSDSGKLRPDMIVKLPGKKCIVIDAKTPLAAYLNMVEAKDEDTRLRYLKEHGNQVKTHINQLSNKAYWDQFEESPEFVVLFLPNEALYGAALEVEPLLIEIGSSKNVIIATPTTLIALLKAIAYGWNQASLAENARIISILGKELYDRMSVLVEHFEGIKKGLDKSVEAYNKAIGTFESRVLPTTRKFKELGISSDKELGELTDIEKQTKDLREI